MTPIVSVPISPMVELEEEKITNNPQWALFFTILISQLQDTLTPQGINFTPLTADQIAGLNDPAFSGRGVYNTTLGTFMVNQNGTFKTITTS